MKTNELVWERVELWFETWSSPEEVDSESVDEGFMDELDSKITSLKIQQRAALSKLQAP